MNSTFRNAALFVLATLSSGQVLAWASANRFGGSTSHSWGSTSHENRWGGSSTHTAGEGTSHTNVYGGSTSHSVYGGTSHTNMYGGTAYRPPGGYGYVGYHPPTAVPYYSSGCYGCAAAAGAVVGIAAGAAVASANTQAATSNAYASGVAAGSASTAAAYGSAAYVIGVNYATIPKACATPVVHGQTYYLCGNTWFQPVYGANGVYYRVVPTP